MSKQKLELQEILNTSYGQYFHLNITLAIVLFFLGVLIESGIIWIVFRKNKEITEIVVAIILTNFLTFMLGVVSVSLLV